MEMQTQELIQTDVIEQFRGRPFLIMGAAPSLNKLDYWNVVFKNTVVVALNNTFLKWQSDILFFADPRFLRRFRVKIPGRLFCVYPECLQRCFHHSAKYSWIYGPSLSIGEDLRRLRAGYSVLIPALHFAYLLASKIQIVGWEMKNHSHWNRSRKSKRFPKAQDVKNQVLEIQAVFQKPIEFLE